MTLPEVHMGWIWTYLPSSKILDIYVSTRGVYGEIQRVEQKYVSMIDLANNRIKDNTLQDVIMNDVVVTPTPQIKKLLHFRQK